MSNPFPAFKNTFCYCCDEEIEEGDDVWIFDGTKLCTKCADDEGWICECGSFKKPEYATCYLCRDNFEN